MSLISEKMNRFNPNSPTRCSRLAKLDALDNYIVKCVLENPSKLNRNDIIKYRDYLFNLFKSHPLISLDNILFRKDIVTRLFSTDQIKEINDFKKQTSEFITNIEYKIDNGQQISKQEHDKYLIFLIAQINNDNQNSKDRIANEFGRLLQNPTNMSILEKEFMFKYVAHLVAKECNIPGVAVYISDDHFDGRENSQVNGCSYGNTSIIIINRKNVIKELSSVKNIDPVIKMIQTIAHETRHSYQAYGAANNDNSYSSIEYIRNLLYSKYLSTQQFNEYHTNYASSEIENDSNKYGWTFTTKILEKYNPKLVSNINNTINLAIQTQYKQHLGNKTDGSIRKTKEIYNVHFMDEIIRLHPEELRNYPQLQAFYNLDGTKKDIISMMTNEENTKDNGVNSTINPIFSEYYLYSLDKGILDTLSLESLSQEQLFLLFDRLNHIIDDEVDYLSHTIDILYKGNVTVFEKVNKVRIERIQKLIDYYNKNTRLLNELCKIDLTATNRHMFGFSLDITYRKISGLQRKINKTEVLKETQIYQELTELSEVEYNGPRF